MSHLVASAAMGAPHDPSHRRACMHGLVLRHPPGCTVLPRHGAVRGTMYVMLRIVVVRQYAPACTVCACMHACMCAVLPSCRFQHGNCCACTYSMSPKACMCVGCLYASFSSARVACVCMCLWVVWWWWWCVGWGGGEGGVACALSFPFRPARHIAIAILPAHISTASWRALAVLELACWWQSM